MVFSFNYSKELLSYTMERFITKRKDQLEYMEKVHQGKVHFMNIIKLEKRSFTNLQDRTTRWSVNHFHMLVQLNVITQL